MSSTRGSWKYPTIDNSSGKFATCNLVLLVINFLSFAIDDKAPSHYLGILLLFLPNQPAWPADEPKKFP